MSDLTPGRTSSGGAAVPIDVLRAPDVELEDIVGGLPNWIGRASAIHLLLLFAGLGSLLWFVEYPEVVHAPVAITAEVPPAPVYSRQAGQLKLWVAEHAQVEAGQILGEITGSADAASVIALRQWLASLRRELRSASVLSHPAFADLGELQVDYSSLVEALQELRVHDVASPGPISREADARRLDVLLRVREETRTKNALSAEAFALAQQAYRRDQSLHAQNLLAPTELDARRQRVLELEGEKRAADLALMSMEGEIQSLRANIERSRRVEQIERERLTNRVAQQLASLESRIARWEETHLLQAPVRGRVVLHKYWSDFQHVGAEQEVLVVRPASDRVLGKAMASVSSAGRLRAGQRVVVRVAEYPYEEFGTLHGRVAAVARSDADKKYIVTVSFPDGLVTSRGRTLTLGQGMTGSAGIITEDLRLAQRVFHQIARFFTRGEGGTGEGAERPAG
jgi:hypothetical protein